MRASKGVLWAVGIGLATLVIGGAIVAALLPPSAPPPSVWVQDGDLRVSAAGARLDDFELAPVEYVGRAPTTETPDLLIRHSSEFARSVYRAAGRTVEWWYRYASESAQGSDGDTWRRYERRR